MSMSESSAAAPSRSAVASLDTHPLLVALADDPWSLDHRERQDLAALLAAEQESWLPRIQPLVEPPAVDSSFPAFLLATEAFAGLAGSIGTGTPPTAVDTGTVDQLQRFVDRYRGYLAGGPDSQTRRPI